METSRLLILPLLLACSPILLAADTTATKASVPAAKPQHLSSPDQTPEGLSKSDWSSIRAAYEAGQHAFQPVNGGWQARNPGQQWTTKFDRRGFIAEPKDGSWQWGLELKSYGFDTEPHVIGDTPAVKAEGQRLSYQWDASVQEWFVNDKRGLEHGFTIEKRPVALLATYSSTLDFFLATRGTLRPSVTADAQGVLFQDKAGATVVNYTGLKVWDADGKVLRSRFEAVGETDVRLRVEESGARYPLTIDPIAQQAYLKSGSNSNQVGDRFGASVSVSGDTVVVGAPMEASSTSGVNSTPNESASQSGAAYVFVRNGSSWSQQAYLKASNTGGGDYFGDSVAVSGDTVVVGAEHEDSSTTGVNSTPNEGASQSGAVYVFVRSGTIWSQQAYLKASNTGALDRFGSSVAVSGETVVIGAAEEDSSSTGVNSTPNESATYSGAAYIFTRSGTTWSHQAYLKAGNSGTYAFFGNSVSVSVDTVIVGAFGESSSTTGVNSPPNDSASLSGAAYVFVRSGTAWSQQAYLKASNTGADDQFGVSVAIAGDTVVVGAQFEDSNTTGTNSSSNESSTDSGAAYVFVRNGTAWSQQAYLKASNTGSGDRFGFPVGVSGDTVVVGARSEDGGTTGVNGTSDESAADSGAAYVFARSGTAWSQQAYLKASNTGASDIFGSSVAVSGDTVVLGACLEDSSTTGINNTPNESATDSGASYVFSRSGTTWSQQSFLKADGNSGAEDRFGYSVAVSNDTVVVGAIGEDSSTTGIDSAPNENATDSGAVYIFVRSGTIWSLQAYLKAGNTGAGDSFGRSVAVSGDTVVVGAPFEDSGTMGVNSIFNESALDSGAAYVFVRSGTTWSQQSYLKASNTGLDDRFGGSVAVAGNTAVVGAIGEDSGTKGINSTPNESVGAAGAAYVFARSGTTWSQQAYLKAGNTGANDQFGVSVAASDYTVVVGAYLEASSTTGVNSIPNESAANSGAAYVFVRGGTVWFQEAYLKAGNTGASDLFGISVASSGDTVVVGAQGEDSSSTGVNSSPNESASNSGAAYVFIRGNFGTWSQQAYLKAGNAGAGDNFGSSVAVWGDTVVVGALGEDSSSTGVNSTPNESAAGSGAAYVFARSGAWVQQAYLKAGNTGAGDNFGISVSLSGGTAVVGAYLEASSTAGVNSTPDEKAAGSGAAYVSTGLGPVPTITGISSAFGDVEGGNPVTITGTVFTEATAVTFGGTPATSFTVNSSNSLTAITPAHALGTVNVTVTTPTATATGTNFYNYIIPNIGLEAPSGTPVKKGSSVVFNSGQTSSGLAVTLRNQGNVNLTNISASISGQNAGDFGFASLPPTTLAAGASASFTIRFSATGAPVAPVSNATLSIASSDPYDNPFTLMLEGFWSPPLPGAEDNATLDNLVLTTATLSPAFDNRTTHYAASVPNTTTSLTVMPIPSDWTVSGIKVNGTAVNSGTPSASIALAEGVNVITTVVTAEDGFTKKTYTVTVTRAAIIPLVSSPSATGVTTTSATLGGDVIHPGNDAISSRGVVFAPTATNSNPQIGGAGVSNQPATGSTGVFTVNAISLIPGTAYTFRAYATNSFGTGYSVAGSFTTVALQDIALEAPTGTPVSNGNMTSAFASTALARTKDLVVTVRNMGGVDLALILASITGPDAGEFSLVSSPPTTLAAGGSASFTIRFTPSSLGPRNATLFISSDDPDESPFTLTLTGSGVTPPEAWRYQHFQTNANTGDAADLADPDKDGLVNLLERAFNLNPNQAALPILTAGTGTTGLPLIRRTGQPPVFSIQYVRRKASANSGLIYTPQFSTSLNGDWSAATGTETVQSIDSEWERVTMEDSSTGNSKRFGRVKVSTTP